MTSYDKKNVYIKCKNCLFAKIISINKNLELIPKNVINSFNCKCENIDWEIKNSLSNDFIYYKYKEFIQKKYYENKNKLI